MKAPEYIVLGKLRRDTTIIAQGSADECNTIAEAAVTEGRAAETFVIRVDGYFSESVHNFANPDTFSVGSAIRGAPKPAPALNPDTGPQPVADDPGASELEAPPVQGTSDGKGGVDQAAKEEAIAAEAKETAEKNEASTAAKEPSKSDANKDGVLDKNELAKALSKK